MRCPWRLGDVRVLSDGWICEICGVELDGGLLWTCDDTMSWEPVPEDVLMVRCEEDG